MAIQMRRGAEADFDPSKMVSGEIAITTDTDKMFYKGGSNVEEVQKKLTFDTAPTSESGNPITSGGVYEAVAPIAYQVYFDGEGYLCFKAQDMEE